jgi:hypothetical protein
MVPFSIRLDLLDAICQLWRNDRPLSFGQHWYICSTSPAVQVLWHVVALVVIEICIRQWPLLADNCRSIVLIVHELARPASLPVIATGHISRPTFFALDQLYSLKISIPSQNWYGTILAVAFAELLD